ncbi:hypothetical protein DLAC_05991 [Tieghemostelium lacteum]|uniref:Protein SMG9 n=1 Tax=Tieghemostelium lacteum TaxID=361077 RepID=A0A151ZH77_TIELA|nr:hypothetical protein DLAC_05991 [Tieghemostelium lacteum]|eukprot:KYQ93323.1 hypothetical protein DLAC_05991 [Tieghemostelium lacteum]
MSNNPRVKKSQSKKVNVQQQPQQQSSQPVPKVLLKDHNKDSSVVPSTPTTTTPTKVISEKSNKNTKTQDDSSLKDDVLTSTIDKVNLTVSIKLLSKSLKVNTQNVEILQRILSKENENFMVIGVIGSQSSGKSTILSALAMNSNSKTTSRATSLPFNVQSESNFCLATHQTEGIDIYINQRDKFIYIDTQPLESMSLLCDLIEKNAHLPNNYVSYEHYHHFQSLKIIVFLMSICNVLLIVQENKSLDLSICKLVRSAMMLKNKLPDISQPHLQPPQLNTTLLDNDQFDFKSKLVYIFNKITELDYEMDPLDKTLSNLLTNPKDSYLPPNSIPIIDNFHIAEKKTNIVHLTSNLGVGNANVSTSVISPITNTLIPGANQISNTNMGSIVPKPNKYYPTFTESIDQLKDHIMLLKSTTKFNKSISEKEWLENSLKIYEAIQNSDTIDSYSKQLKPLYNIGLTTKDK